MITEQDILTTAQQRMGITALNDMQRVTLDTWQHNKGDVVLYAPTGTGKTLAQALCLLTSLPADAPLPVAVALEPSRELAMQTAEVLRQLATGCKVTLCCGGHTVADERASLAATPHIIVATPGRLLDHAHRHHIRLATTQLLVVDEVDKMLELGFENEMRQLLHLMTGVRRRLLTSATRLQPVPPFLQLRDAVTIDRLQAQGEQQPPARITTWQVKSPDADKLQTLRQLLLALPPGKVIVFVNHRDSVERIARYLQHAGIQCAPYHGALPQHEREMTVARLNNDSLPVMIATDLAARGLDIDTVTHIVHYHMPTTPQVMTHRNGRTARVDATGDAFVITATDEQLPSWMTVTRQFTPQPARQTITAPMTTLHLQAGRREKLSRGDVMGFIARNGGIDAASIGHIDVRDHYALAAVPSQDIDDVLQRLRPLKIKGRRVKISMLQ